MSPRRHSSLPFLPTPPIGRADDLATLRRLLEPAAGGVRSSRLVSLTGPPGVGKTSLALTVAHELADRFRYGVFLIDLAPVDDPAAVAATIADHLGIRRDGHRASVDQIVRLLRDRSCLLLLDNFEQVAEAAPVVSELLAACPNLVILVTSRAPLHLRWELDVPVGPLTLPRLSDQTEPSDFGALAGMQAAGAVALFVERARARAVQPRFTLTPEHARLVNEVCRLTADHDNLRAATGWAAEQSDVETVLRFGAALWRFWWSRGDAADTRERVGGILALASDVPPTRARAQALHGAGVLARLLGDY